VSKTHKSGDGIRQVDVTEINDPLSTLGDPSGFPRNLLFELRHVQFLHTPHSVVALHMWEKRWRIIWTDGRQLPVDPDPRWYAYSVGRWADDSRFVVNRTGRTSARGSTTPATRTAINCASRSDGAA
jgi:hypothetical protein